MEWLLAAPCIFCGYNGPGYYQAKTHKKHCYWYYVGGLQEREFAFVKAAEERRIHIFPKDHNIEEYYKGEA